MNNNRTADFGNFVPKTKRPKYIPNEPGTFDIL